MTIAHFQHQMDRLRVLRGRPDEEHQDRAMDAYFDALHDVPVEVLTAAVDHALKTRAWFPMPAELRADADCVARASVLGEREAPKVVDLQDARAVTIPNPLGGEALHVTVTRDWYHDCDVCSDTGWEPLWCSDHPSERYPFLRVKACGLRLAHADHDWVQPCACAATNPTIQRRLAAGMKYAKPPEKVSA